jgi:hypothetical protein
MISNNKIILLEPVSTTTTQQTSLLPDRTARSPNQHAGIVRSIRV